MRKINRPNTGIEKGLEENIWRKFLENVENAGHKHETAKFLDSILTANEKKLISKRLAALALIKSEKSYREIGRILWISPSTVSGLKKSIRGIYQSNRYRATKSKNEKRKSMGGIPASTILDYWANLSLPSRTRKRG
ncbi:MAG: Trp family transcriptional regulator [bacterium]|nr:Trp family transcriptional regulator [bacterium]